MLPVLSHKDPAAAIAIPARAKPFNVRQASFTAKIGLFAAKAARSRPGRSRNQVNVTLAGAWKEYAPNLFYFRPFCLK